MAAEFPTCIFLSLLVKEEELTCGYDYWYWKGWRYSRYHDYDDNVGAHELESVFSRSYRVKTGPLWT